MKYSLAVVVHQHPQAGPLSDVLVRALVNGTSQSLRQYWRDMSFGTIDLVPTYYNISYTLTEADTDRTQSAQRAYDALLARTGEASGFHDIYMVLFQTGFFTVPNPNAKQPGQPATLDRQVDGGTTGLANGKPAIVSHANQTHSFMTHELGHAVGFEHSYGLIAGAQAHPGEYGDPTDIMSAELFGRDGQTWGSSPTFTGTEIEGWPASTSSLLRDGPHVSLGPGLSLAHLHTRDGGRDYFPDADQAVAAPHGQQHRSIVTFATTPCTAGLEPAHGAHRGTRLMVVTEAEDAQGRGRLYIEYRPAGGWDAGLGSGDDGHADVAGIIVHELADTRNLGIRPWYRGVVPLPLGPDTDVDILGTPYRVTVTGAQVAGPVHVKVERTRRRALDLTVSITSDIVDVRDLREVRTPCGSAVRWGTWLSRSHLLIRALPVGFGGTGQPGQSPLQLTWQAAGQSVDLGAVDISNLGGTTLAVDLPAGTGGETVLLTTMSGESFSLPVSATAADGTGTLTANTDVAVSGEFTGFHPADNSLLVDCMERIAYERLRLRPQDLVIPPLLKHLPGRIRALDRRERLLNDLEPDHTDDVQFVRNVLAMQAQHFQR